MKKILPKILLLIVIVISLVNISNAGDRMMFIEFFTSSTCGPCASNNPTMTAFLLAQDPDRIAALGHHMNWPSPGNDPMYLYNTADNEARRGYYGINSIPAGQFDGFLSIPLAYSTANLTSTFNSRKDILSPFTIILTDTAISSDSMLVRAKIHCETYLTNPTVTAYIALCEGLIHYTSPPGTNGETDFHYVMRKILPTGTGTPITLLPGQSVTLEYKYRKDPIWQWAQMFPIAYIQDPSTKEILQSAKKTANFTLLTNPGFVSAPQGTASTKNFKVSVPVVASGYTSPVTFTAEVSPVTSGVTATFPSGTVLSNFPDSLTVQVSSTASVPVGTYKIIVTGTNAAGKIHKIALDYLVGKNYVTVKANRPSLSFKVNGTTYTSQKLFLWDINSAQTVEAVSPQTSSGYRYVFTNWSNNGDTNLVQHINVNANTGTYIANYKVQYRAYAYANPVGIPVTFTNSNVYFDSGSVVNMTVSPYQLQFNGMTYYFNHWEGQGEGSYSGTNFICTVNMRAPIVEKVLYDTINTGVNIISTEIPERYKLYQNYPNPFNPQTSIKFDIPKSGLVNLKIFDLLGKEVKSLYSGNLNAGKYEFTFNGIDMASGIYFYKLQTDNFSQVMKMLLIK
jgi:hypothetical protein